VPEPDDTPDDRREQPEEGSGGPVERPRQSGTKLARALKRVNRDPALLNALRRAREKLPGDSRFGDPLSFSTEGELELAERIASMAPERPGLLGEVGLSALQLWQAASEAQGRGRGERDVAILFTDLVEFSSWALEAGDEAALELLREVSRAIEPPVRDNGGDVVKRLGDGMMAVFREPRAAVSAVLEGRERLGEVEAHGYRPRIRAGVHLGRPRRIGRDYLGVDVNVAARIADEASADELLVSDRALELLDHDAFKSRRKRMLRPKGVPRDIEIYSVKPKG
jgi:adenylate cyclase